MDGEVVGAGDHPGCMVEEAFGSARGDGWIWFFFQKLEGGDELGGWLVIGGSGAGGDGGVFWGFIGEVDGRHCSAMYGAEAVFAEVAVLEGVCVGDVALRGAVEGVGVLVWEASGRELVEFVGGERR